MKGRSHHGERLNPRGSGEAIERRAIASAKSGRTEEEEEAFPRGARVTRKRRGGKVDGKKAAHRLDKRARGGACEEERAKGGGVRIKASHRGLLHKDLGVKAGEPISAKKLAAAKKSSDPAVRKRATFAENAKHWHH